MPVQKGAGVRFIYNSTMVFIEHVLNILLMPRLANLILIDTEKNILLDVSLFFQ